MIKASIDHTTGWITLDMGYNLRVNEYIKQFPGSRWVPQIKKWQLPCNLWPVVRESEFFKHAQVVEKFGQAPLVIFSDKLYQDDASRFLLARPGGAALKHQARVGKTRAVCHAIASMFAAGAITRAFVLYPSNVKFEWRNQLWKWIGAQIVDLSSIEPTGKRELAPKGARAHCSIKDCPNEGKYFSPIEQDQGLGSICATHWNEFAVWLTIHEINAKPFLIVGAQHDQLAMPDFQEKIKLLASNQRYLIHYDEIQLMQNPRAKKGEFVRSFAQGAVARWASTATMIRNIPENARGVFDLLTPGSMGGDTKYVTRYCGGEILEHGHHTVWENGEAEIKAGHRDRHGSSNAPELKARIDAISHVKKRSDPDVAPHLPKTEHRITICEASPEDLGAYGIVEKAYAKKLLKRGDAAGPNGEDSREQKALTLATSTLKVPTAIRKAVEAASNGKKVIIYTFYKETLAQVQAAYDALLGRRDFTVTDDPDDAPDGAIIEDHGQTLERCGNQWHVQKPPPYFLASGWQSVEDRRAEIDKWQAYRGGSVLLATVLANLTGIDLADAEIAFRLELGWVAADIEQSIERQIDVHLGKRLVGAVQEYLIVKGTIDERMAGKLLGKIVVLKRITGVSEESDALARALEAAGINGGAYIDLPDNEASTMKAVRDSIIARYSQEDVGGASAESLQGQIEEVFDDPDPDPMNGAEIDCWGSDDRGDL